jgi:hypothetical protein
VERLLEKLLGKSRTRWLVHRSRIRLKVEHYPRLLSNRSFYPSFRPSCFCATFCVPTVPRARNQDSQTTSFFEYIAVDRRVVPQVGRRAGTCFFAGTNQSPLIEVGKVFVNLFVGQRERGVNEEVPSSQRAEIRPRLGDSKCPANASVIVSQNAVKVDESLHWGSHMCRTSHRIYSHESVIVSYRLSSVPISRDRVVVVNACDYISSGTSVRLR